MLIGKIELTEAGRGGGSFTVKKTVFYIYFSKKRWGNVMLKNISPKGKKKETPKGQNSIFKTKEKNSYWSLIFRFETPGVGLGYRWESATYTTVFETPCACSVQCESIG